MSRILLRRLLQDLSKAEILKLVDMQCHHRRSVLEHPACFSDFGKGEKVAILDIESTGLTASYGYCFSWCLKPTGKDRFIGRVLKPKEILKHKFDRDLMAEFCEEVKKYDRVVTHYGIKFDLPFLRTRCLKHGLDFPLLKSVNISDTWLMSKFKLKMHSNRLEAIAEFFDIPAKGHKMNPHVWNRALSGCKDSLDHIWTHNKEDVVTTDLVYEKLRDYYPYTKRSI